METDMEGARFIHRSLHGNLLSLQVKVFLFVSIDHLISILSFISRYCLSVEQQMEFEKLIRWCRQQSTGGKTLSNFHSGRNL